MSALERLVQAGTNSVGQYSFIDADTLRDSKDPDKTYRLQGFDAPEIAKFNEQGKAYATGTAGGSTATSAITSLAESRGFNNLIKTGKVDPNGREIVELHDDKGRNFTTELLKSGALDPGKYTTQEDIDAVEVAKLFGHESAGSDEFGKAAATVQEAIQSGSQVDLQFKEQAVSEAQFALNGDRFSSAVQFRDNDRTIRNDSRNPMSDAWEQGWIGAKEGAYGFLELLGESTNSEYLNDIGEAGVIRAQSQQAEYARILTDWKDVEGFKSGVSFLANNAAMSLPYMITTAGATVAGTLAAPIIGTAGAVGVGIGAPATIYAGQVWNEMEGEKSASVALTAGLVQGALDRIGIGAIAGRIIPDQVTGQAIQKIMKETGVTKAAAEATLAQATKRELAGYLGDTAKIAAQQITAKKVGQELLKKASIGALGEAGTEALQEATAYVAATQGSSDKDFDWNELNERLVAAAIAGGSLGGAFTVPGTVKNSLAWADAVGQGQEATSETASQSQVYADLEKSEKGYVPSINEEINNTRTRIAAAAPGLTIAERADAHRSAHQKKSTIDKATEAFLNAPALWRGATRNIFTPDLQQRSRSARVLADMFGGNLQRIFSGSSFENSKHHRVSMYKNMVPMPEQLYNVFGKGKRLTEKVKADISGQVYSTLRAATDKDGNFDPNLVPESEHRQAILQFATQLNALSDKMHADQAKHNPELGYIKNYLFKYKALNKKAVHKNRVGFQSLLQKKHGYSAKEARELVDTILNDPNVSDLGQAFSVVKGGIVPASHNKRSLGLSEDADFNEFMENDIFSNVSQAAKSAARYSAHRDYVGKNGEVVSQLLQEMQAEGVPAAEVDKIAAQLQDYLDAESGNYKRPTSDAGKKFQQIQKSAMMFMTLSGLPLATISSFVELMLINKGLNHNQVFGKEGSLKTIGKQGASMLVSGSKEIYNFAARKEDTGPLTTQQELLRDLGYYDWDVGAATVTGVTEINSYQQKIYDSFFKATGLTGWTNYTRAVRASMAADYMVDKSEIVWKSRQNGETKTREVQEAEEALRNLGVDVDNYIAIQTKVTAGIELSPDEQTFFDDTLREATFTFTNDAVALPQSANRPLIYQDPRFALFTQFQGFLATFTANHIPKLWGEYVKRGTPAMKYNAFAVMATMIMMGFAAQHLKDWIKYGAGDELDEDKDYQYKTGRNPYLEPAEYVRRGVQASGLLGTAERPINFFFPIYEQSSDGAGDWLFNTAVGESPALGYVQRGVGATASLAEGDVGRATKQAVKSAPIFGPFSYIADKAGDAASVWNFNGG